LVEIIDVQGKLVYQQFDQMGLNTIDVSGLHQGIYFVTASVNGKSARQKLIIQ